MDMTDSPQALWRPGRKILSANSLKNVWLLVREGGSLDIIKEEWNQYQFKEHIWADPSSCCHLKEPHPHCQEASCSWCRP